MSASQTNTRKGPIPLTANDNQTGKEGYLAKIVNDSGETKAALPSAATDETPYLIIDGLEAGGLGTFAPLTPEELVRLKLNGTATAGDMIVREDETGADTGKVRKLPAAAGTYTIVGLAMEGGVDGQLLLTLPWRSGQSVTVV